VGLADFSLALLRDGVPIAARDSNVDNLEHLSWTLEKSANYSLQVYRFDGGGLATENFALAARVLNLGSGAGVTRALSLDAEGTLAMAMAAPVPEPGGVFLAFAAVFLTTRGRRARR